MRRVARRNVEGFCASIASRSLTDVECENLFVTMREEFPADRPPTPAAPPGTISKVRDLGNSMAHKHRDRGYVSDYLRDFADRWRAEKAKEGDRSIDIDPLYPIEEIYAELFYKLDELKIDHDPRAMYAAEYHFVSRIGWALDGRRVMLDKKDSEDYCIFLGDVGEDSRIVQPGCMFNKCTIEFEDWGDEDEPTLFGIPTNVHGHFTMPLLTDFIGRASSESDDQ